jgi:hypothetical protein
VILKLTTTYVGVDHHWLKWWIETSGPNYMIDSVKDRPIFPAEMTSKDPTSSVIATTRIELLEEDEAPPESEE